MILETHPNDVSVIGLYINPAASTLANAFKWSSKSKDIVLRLGIESQQHLIQRQRLGAVYCNGSVMFVGDFGAAAARNKEN